MFTTKYILRTAAIGLLAITFVAPRLFSAETTPDSERLEKLERAVEQLQKRNAELETEVKSLKQQTTAFAPPAEGPTKTKVVSDGKTYVEKSVPVEKSAADKWKLSTPITELELYGDVRLRYEYRGGETNDDSPLGRIASGTAGRNDWQERERERYRIRLGLRGTLMDDWFFGIRLETSQNPRSTNVTFGDDTSGSSSAANNAPFSKVSDGINVGQAYVGYKGFPDITLTGGKMPNPFVTTLMVWDPDISPEGLSEQWKHTFKFGSVESEPAAYSKDGKAIAAPPSEPFLKLDLFANFAQFVYDGTALTNPLGPRPTHTQPGQTGSQLVPNTNAFLLAWQVGAKLNFPKTFYFQFAPTIYNYTGNGTSFDTHFQGGDPFLINGTSTTGSLGQNQTGINSLLVFDVPAEFGFKVNKLPVKIFGDFAANMEGDDRASAAGHSGSGDQRYAFQAGAGVGQLKKKHDWEVDVWWQHTEQYALDPNLIDDDIFDARTNMQGVVAKAGYMLSDAVSVNFTYAHGWQIDDNLGTGGLGGSIGINPLDNYNLFQADLNLKF
jgi:hypothetical protein